jgi:hypothetical protein
MHAMAADRNGLGRRLPKDNVMLASAARSDALRDRITLIIEMALSLLIFSASIVSIYLQGI